MALRAHHVAVLALALGTALPAAAQQASPLDQPGLREYVTQVLRTDRFVLKFQKPRH